MKSMIILTASDEIRSAVLVVHGEKAHSRYFGEDAFKKLKGDDKEHTFDHAQSYFHIISDVLGGHEVGIYCAGGCTGCEKTARDIDGKHLKNAYRMGLESI